MKSTSLEGHYAGFVSRAVAVVLDVWVAGALTSLLIFLLIRGMGLFGATVATCQEMASLSPTTRIACLGGTLGLIAVVLLTTPLYYTLLWALVGQTVGQRLIGLRVLNLDGDDLGVVRSFTRFVAYSLCLLTLGIGFLWVLVDDRRMGWHDKIARTCVVYAWKAQQNEDFVARVRNRFRRNRDRKAPAREIAS
jgi:uncharacterized RDD family membrane protein YckC